MIKPYQLRSEITRLLELLAREPPTAVLEIGTAWGGTLFLLTRVAAEEATLVSVDIPEGSMAAVNATRGSLYRSFARASQRVEFVRADSHAAATRVAIERLFEGRGVDFLVIDGDHGAEGVRADFRDYVELVAPGGRIAFHDIVPGDPDRTGEVPEFWQELRLSYPGTFEEIVEDWGQGGFGIGLLRV
jgi:cephalosporin hydroxylase